MNVWNHLSENQIGTNLDPVYGGIVDKNIISGLWFAIPNHDDIPFADKFISKEDAIAYIVTSAEALEKE